MTFQKKQVLVVAKTYPNLSQKYDRTVCTAGIDLETKSWIRIFPIQYFDLKPEQKFHKFDIIEVEVEYKKDKFARKESHKAQDKSIKIIGKIDTKNSWAERKKILFQMVKKSVRYLEGQYEVDNTSLGLIKPRGVKFKVTPIESCRKWEKDLIIGKQRTLFGTAYHSPLEKIPYKFSYTFKCADPECTIQHDLMIEDWEICELYRKMKQQSQNEEYALKKVAEKYRDFFLIKRDIYLVLGTESKWNKLVNHWHILPRETSTNYVILQLKENANDNRSDI